MPAPPATISRRRRLGASAALVATAGGLAAVAVHDLQWVEWSLLAFAGVVAAAGVGLARRSMVTQVLSRATAWLVLAPSAIVTAVSTLGGHAPDLAATGLALGSGAALLLARPMLDTADARAQFDPVSYRRWLMAAATASASAGIVTGVVGLDAMRWGSGVGTGLGLGALALALLGSALGVVRMRAWGLLLGVATSLSALLAALLLHDARGVALALTAIPGLMLALPVLLAGRARAQAARGSATATHVRVAASSFDDEAAAAARLRVATGDQAEDDAADTDAADTSAAPGRARRSALSA